jgi:hypothetical protein
MYIRKSSNITRSNNNSTTIAAATENLIRNILENQINDEHDARDVCHENNRSNNISIIIIIICCSINSRRCNISTNNITIVVEN